MNPITNHSSSSADLPDSSANANITIGNIFERFNFDDVEPLSFREMAADILDCTDEPSFPCDLGGIEL
ncbi:hypothetical protein [Methanolobus sp. WCC4]|uniref:hypothetical protein n=1 Tax=Methanolobus sp. WCC4 TaxID=3125784 RepID=UPI0030F7265B